MVDSTNVTKIYQENNDIKPSTWRWTWFLAFTNGCVQLFDGAFLAVCVLVIRNQIGCMIGKSEIASERIFMQAIVFSIHAVFNIVTVSTYYHF